MKVLVRNYQAITNGEIDIKGLTVLVGDTHSGKSSFMRAIEAALYNQRGNYFVQKGARFTDITIKFDFNDVPVTWIWVKGATASLQYNNDVYRKLGATAPADFLKEIGFPELEIGDSVFRPQFQHQLSPLFATQTKSTNLFNLFLSFTQFDRLPLVRVRVDRDVNEIKARNKFLRESVDKEQARFDHSSALLHQLQTSPALREFRIVRASMERLELVSALVAKARHVHVLARRVDQLLALGERLGASVNHFCGSLDKFQSLYDILVESSSVVRQSGIIKSRISSLREISSSLEEFNSLFEKFGDINSLVILDSRVDEDLVSAKSNVMKLKNLQVPLEKFAASIDKFRVVDSLVSSLFSAEEQLQDLSQDSHHLESQLSLVVKELSEYESCPLCGSSLEGGFHA